MGEILIGTSGFSYEDWRGFFYPEKIRKEEMLAHYATRFRAVEVNSTYYALPPPATFAGMVRKTPGGFKFAVKANKDITHAPNADLNVFKQFILSVRPLADAGKLGCVLAQYPWSFRRSQVNADRLRQLREEFGDLPLVVEFRHFSWVAKDAVALLRELGIGYCCVDEPKLKGLMPPVAGVTSDIGYVRFHGRNARKWFDHEQTWERYDYLYANNELAEWTSKVESLASKTRETYVFFNNHYQGKAAQNAVTFAGMLGMALQEGG